MATEAPERDGPAARHPAPPQAPGAARAPRWARPSVAGLCALALALRALIGLHSGVFRDEGLLLFVAGEPSWGAMIDFLRLHESHPPLFYALLRAWLSLAGDSDAAALAVPVVLGGALVPALYAVGARLLSWRAGLLAAAMAALSPILAGYGALVRPYSLLPLLTLAATYALVRAVDLGGWRRWAAYAGAVLGLVYTHNWSWLVLAAQWVAVVTCLWRGVPRPRADVVRGWAGAQAAIAIGFLPWLGPFLHQAAHAGYSPSRLFAGATGPGDVAGSVVAVAVAFLAATLAPSGASPLPGAAVIWGLAVTAVAVLLRRHAPRSGGRPPAGRTTTVVLAVTPLAATCVAVPLSERSNLLAPYCLAMLAPLLLLLVAHGLDRLGAAGQRPIAGTAAVAVLVGYAALLPALYQNPRSNAREVAHAVASQAAPSDLVVVAPWWLASSFNRYYSLPTEQIDFPAAGRVGITPYDDEVRRLADPAALARAERRIAASRTAGRRIWFVSEPPARACPEPHCDDAVPTDPGNYSAVGAARAAGLRDYVTGLYGAPVRCDAYDRAPARLENLTACLFVAR